MKISKIHARQILDSRGNPTLEADVYLENGVMGRAAVPSGASTGIYEAVELRDNDPKIFGGKGVLKAVQNVNTEISKSLIGEDASDQKSLDEKMIALDGTPNKGRLGANAILSVSLAAAHASSKSQNIPLYAYIASLAGIKNDSYSLPIPMMNLINGGKHGGWGADIQEFMILPVGGKSFSEALRMGTEVFHSLKKVIKQNGYRTAVGDEGGYAPILKKGNAEAFDLLTQAVTNAGYALQKDIVFAVDAAASEFYIEGKYSLKSENRVLTSDELVEYWMDLNGKYPIVSIEDGFSQEDWPAWTKLTSRAGDKIQIVADDLLVTNMTFLKRGIEEKAANSILIKLNQIGTLTETINAVAMAHNANWTAVISHRSGETEDTTISHLVTALSTGQIKTGSASRTDRIAKYNELLRIEEQLGDKAQYKGPTTFKK